MKQQVKFIIFLIIFIIIISLAPARSAHINKIIKRESLEKRQENYIDIQNLNFTEKQLERMNKIHMLEFTALRPIALNLESYLLRLDELNNTKCKWYQNQCKKEIKQNKTIIAEDIKELQRQIRQKKEYYKILYINETTRAQHNTLRQIIKNITNDRIQLW